MTKEELSVRKMLSEMVKEYAEKALKVGENLKAQRLIRLSKDVFSEGPIDNKLNEIQKILDISLPSFTEVFGDVTVEDAMKGLQKEIKSQS